MEFNETAAELLSSMQVTAAGIEPPKANPFLGAIEAGKSTSTYFGVEALNIFGQSDVSSRVSFCIFAAKYKYAGVMVE